MPDKPAIDLVKWVQAAPGPLAAAVGDELALLSLPQGRYYGLNATGAQIWRWLEQPCRVSELLERLLAHYQVEPSVGQSDLLELLGRLADSGLIEVQLEGKPVSGRWLPGGSAFGPGHPVN